jgi:hypothetical protein
MHVARAHWPSSNGKTYESICLRESYRDGTHVRKRDIANLTNCDPKKVAAIELALKFKGDLSVLGTLDNIQLRQGLSVGAVWSVYEVARRLVIDTALGRDFDGQLALWQVLARVLDQGSRLSAVRLAQVHAACDVIAIRRGFDENDLYANLGWLSQQQQAIEDRLFASRKGPKPELFLYDVTSSYLEDRPTRWELTVTTAMARKARNRSSSACHATSTAIRFRPKCFVAIPRIRPLSLRRSKRPVSASAANTSRLWETEE